MTTFFVGQKLEPGMFPMVEDIYRIDAPAEKAWYVIHTDAACETKVCRKLEEAGLGAYAPISAEWRKQSRREVHQKKPKVRIERPLLTRYAFAELPVTDPGCALRIADGAREVLGFGENKFAVPSQLIDALREREASGEFDRTVKRGRVIAPKWAVAGRPVRIADGPFAGFAAVIERCLPHDLVEVVFSMFGRQTKAKLELAQIDKT